MRLVGVGSAILLTVFLGVTSAAARGGRNPEGGLHLRRDPADPWRRVPPVRYEPIMGVTQSFRPVEPLSWEELNRRVGPKVKPAAPPPAENKN